MDLLTVISIAVAAFVIFVLLTAYFMKATLYTNNEASQVKLNNEIDNKDNDTTKKDDGN